MHHECRHNRMAMFVPPSMPSHTPAHYPRLVMRTIAPFVAATPTRDIFTIPSFPVRASATGITCGVFALHDLPVNGSAVSQRHQCAGPVLQFLRHQPGLLLQCDLLAIARQAVEVRAEESGEALKLV